jgi:hypothetical protein
MPKVHELAKEPPPNLVEPHYFHVRTTFFHLPADAPKCENFLHAFHIKICTHKTPWEWNYYVVVV